MWIRQQISENYFTDHPVTAIIEVTVSLSCDKKTTTATKEEKNRFRVSCYDYISEHMSGEALVWSNPVTMRFEQHSARKVHFISKESFTDNVRSEFMKVRLGAIEQTLNQRHPGIRVALQFLVSKPLDYIPQTIIQRAAEQLIQQMNVVNENAADADTDPPSDNETETLPRSPPK